MSEPTPTAQRVVVPRWVQLVAVSFGLLALYALARAADTVVLVFLLASVIALILNPVVKRLERPLGARGVRLPRGLAVAGVYVGFVLLLLGAGLLLANPVVDQVQSLQRDVPGLIDSANRSLEDVQRWLDDQGIDVEVKAQGETALSTLQRNVLNQSGDLVTFGQDLLTRLVETGFGLILVVVISIYMLLYAERIGRVVRSLMPAGGGGPEDDFPLRAQKAVFSYVRGQALFSLIMGASAGFAMWVLGVTGVFPDGDDYALFFGIFFGVMELIPYIGPVLGALPPILVALFDDPLTAVWVALTFVALQQLEGHVVAPQVFGHSLRINPLLVIFALLTGGELYGILGALVALPLAAVGRETVVYLRRHLVLEPWGTMTAAELVAQRTSPAPEPPPPG